MNSYKIIFVSQFWWLESQTIMTPPSGWLITWQRSRKETHHVQKGMLSSKAGETQGSVL